MKPPTSAIPEFYFSIFAFYEPALTILGFIGAVYDPETVSLPLIPFHSDEHLTFNPIDPQYPSPMANG